MAYPVRTPKSSQAAPASASGSNHTATVSGGGFFKKLVVVILILVVLGGSVYFLAGYVGVGKFIPGSDFLRTEWQAVFLTNGQVYFGKVHKMHPDILIMKDIYYLQMVNVDNSAALGQPPDIQAQPEQRLTLIKLGNEIHGPLDVMYINRDHVVIVEELKPDSRVVQAINEYHQENPVE